MVLRSRTYRYRRSREHPRVQELKIDSIVQDARLQVRQKIDESVVRRYASLYRTGVELPPIQVIKIGKEHVLADGWHRIAALRLFGRTEVSAEVIEGTLADARATAALANLKSGKPLRRAEIHAAFRLNVKAKRHLRGDGSLNTYREIAAELGGTRAYTTIRNLMMRHFPRIAAQYGTEFIAPDHEFFLRATLGGLARTIEAYASLKSPDQRAEAIERAEETLRKMKAHAEPRLSNKSRDLTS